MTLSWPLHIRSESGKSSLQCCAWPVNRLKTPMRRSECVLRAFWMCEGDWLAWWWNRSWCYAKVDLYWGNKTRMMILTPLPFAVDPQKAQIFQQRENYAGDVSLMHFPICASCTITSSETPSWSLLRVFFRSFAYSLCPPPWPTTKSPLACLSVALIDPGRGPRKPPIGELVCRYPDWPLVQFWNVVGNTAGQLKPIPYQKNTTWFVMTRIWIVTRNWAPLFLLSNWTLLKILQICYQLQVLLDAKDLLTTNKHVIRNFVATYPDIKVRLRVTYADKTAYLCTRLHVVVFCNTKLCVHLSSLQAQNKAQYLTQAGDYDQILGFGNEDELRSIIASGCACILYVLPVCVKFLDVIHVHTICIHPHILLTHTHATF